MPTCNICQFQVIDKSVKQCPNCGAEIKMVIPDQYLDDDSYEELGQGNIESSIDLPDDPSQEVTARSDNDLEICSPGDFLAAEQAEPINCKPDESEKIKSASPSSPESDKDKNPEANTDSEHAEINPELQRLSQKQAESIRTNLLDSAPSPASPADAIGLTSNGDLTQIRSLNSDDSNIKTHQNQPGSSGNLVSENHSTPAPSSSPKLQSQQHTVRGVAYFHKNFIQLGGKFHPVSGEEMIVGERHYLLKPKKIKPQFAITAFSILLVLLLVAIGSQFISPTVPGDGAIIGMVVGSDGRPISDKVQINLAGTGKSTASDPAGFFRFYRVPPGIYKVDFEFPGGKTGTADLSVVDNQTTTLVLGKSSQFQNERLAATSRQPVRADINPGRAPKAQPPPPPPIEKPQNQAPTKKKQAIKQFAALKLKTNVENAKLIVDGQILGIGNLTYRKLNPGSHKATISKEGYKPWSGKIKLTADKTYTLSVELTRAIEKKAEPTYTAQDFYQSGQANLNSGNMANAIADFTEAINLDPSMAKAIFGRAEANNAVGEYNVAEIDFVRAGEIFASKKRTSDAKSAFKEALKINSKSIPALLNQADMARKEKDREAALKNYKAVLRIDKNNFRANLEMGKTYYAMGKHRNASKLLKTARSINPSEPSTYRYLMLNYFARDDFKRVKQTYSDFQKNTSDKVVQTFKENRRYDAILRVVGEYKHP